MIIMDLLDVLHEHWMALRLYERRCAACHAPFTPRSCTDAPFCPACMAALAASPQPSCQLCGQRLGTKDAPYCGECLHTPPPWDGFLMIGPYKGLLRETILQAKFHSDMALLDALGRLLADRFRATGGLPPGRNYCVVPMPLHPDRLRERGFSQCLEIARGLAGELRLPLMPALLHKIRATPSQRTLVREARLQNVARSFAADPAAAGRHILLLDDVMSTGATMRHAAACLLEQGAASVFAAVLSRDWLDQKACQASPKQL